MVHKSSSGQALVEYGLILILVALASIIVLSVLGPSIGITFNNAADDASNPEVRAIQQRQTAIALGTVSFGEVPTSANTVGPPTLTYTSVPPGSTFTNTPVIPTATNTLFVPSFTPTPDWIFCANEGGLCSFSGPMEVRYGESGSYFYLVLTDGTPCTNAVFGDPIVGVGKHCYYRPTTLVPTLVPSATVTNTPIPTAVSEWTFCADENGTCSFSGMKEVRYGESGYYKYLIFAGSTPCTNTVFGDPIPGVYKHCYYRDTTLVPTATPDLNATALAYANATATVLAANTTATAVAANATATVVAAANQTATAYAAANPIVSVDAVRLYHSTEVTVNIVLTTRLNVTIYDSQSDAIRKDNKSCNVTCSKTFTLNQNTQRAAGTVIVTVVLDGETYTLSDGYDAWE
jgi:Flp pilus assembly pilin Flp